MTQMGDGVHQLVDLPDMNGGELGERSLVPLGYGFGESSDGTGEAIADDEDAQHAEGEGCHHSQHGQVGEPVGELIELRVGDAAHQIPLVRVEGGVSAVKGQGERRGIMLFAACCDMGGFWVEYQRVIKVAVGSDDRGQRGTAILGDRQQIGPHPTAVQFLARQEREEIVRQQFDAQHAVHSAV